MSVLSTRYEDILSKTGGIDIPQENHAEVNFEGSDLGKVMTSVLTFEVLKRAN